MKNLEITLDFVLGKLSHTIQYEKNRSISLWSNRENMHWIEFALKQFGINFSLNELELLEAPNCWGFKFNLEQVKYLAPEFYQKCLDVFKVNFQLETLTYKKINSGEFLVSIELDGKLLSAKTNNSLAIDAAFDELYDDIINDERFYESQYQAQKALMDEIIEKNN